MFKQQPQTEKQIQAKLYYLKKKRKSAQIIQPVEVESETDYQNVTSTQNISPPEQTQNQQQHNTISSPSKKGIQTQKRLSKFFSQVSSVAKSLTKAVYNASKLVGKKLTKTLTTMLQQPTTRTDVGVKKVASSDSKDASTEIRKLLRYLIKGVEVLELFLNRAENELDNQEKYYRYATDLICWMLKNTLMNESFRDIVQRLEKTKTLYEAELIRTTTNSNHLKKFLEKEYGLLQTYDVSISKNLISEIANLLIEMGREKVTYPNAIEAIQHLFTEMKRFNEGLITNPKELENTLLIRRKIIKAIVVIGGIIVSLINLLAEEEGIIPPNQAFVSEMVGSAIIGAAATEAMSLI